MFDDTGIVYTFLWGQTMISFLWLWPTAFGFTCLGLFIGVVLSKNVNRCTCGDCIGEKEPKIYPIKGTMYHENM